MRAIVARSGRKQPFDVLRQDVGLEVDLGARTELAERRRRQRVRDERDLEAGLVERGDRQRDPLDRDRALLHAVAEELRRRFDAQADALALGRGDGHLPDAVAVALDVVAAQWLL